MIIEAICLYLKNHIPLDYFLEYVYEHADEAETVLGEDLFLTLISVNPKDKVSVETMIVGLEDYMKCKYLDAYNRINDAYVERVVDSERQDSLALFLREQNKRTESIEIDISSITDEKEMIEILKKKLDFGDFCGNSWEALYDLIYDIKLPLKIVIIGRSKVESTQTEMIKRLDELFSIISNVCEIIYE